MLVKCIKSFNEQISADTIYLVLEVYISRSKPSIDYRVLDNDGCPAIYEAKNFEVVSDRLDGFGFVVKEDFFVLSPEILIQSDLNEKNIDGFWGCYFEDSSTLNDAVKTLKKAILQVSQNEDMGSVESRPLEDMWSAPHIGDMWG